MCNSVTNAAFNCSPNVSDKTAFNKVTNASYWDMFPILLYRIIIYNVRNVKQERQNALFIDTAFRYNKEVMLFWWISILFSFQNNLIDSRKLRASYLNSFEKGTGRNKGQTPNPATHVMFAYTYRFCSSLGWKTCICKFNVSHYLHLYHVNILCKYGLQLYGHWS